MKERWQDSVERAVGFTHTPFYLCKWEPVVEALDELRVLDGALALRHWLSFKTHPVAPLVRMWRSLGYGVEVVSECELYAAAREGFGPESIIVNGVAKHSWLEKQSMPRLRVHFDSLKEIEVLKATARNDRWHVGLRCHTSEERDPDEPQFAGQFGLDPDDVPAAVQSLLNDRMAVEGLHFHLGTNLPEIAVFGRAFREMLRVSQASAICPSYVDLGGGLPVPDEPNPQNRSQRQRVDLSRLSCVVDEIREACGPNTEVWFEFGRYLTARSSVLVVQVQDVKDRKDSRYLICDGGRTNHALVSDWEAHDVFLVPERSGESCHTTICGPSCMAYDRLDRVFLPSDVRVGDFIVWMNAGAYHIPWETRFSRGLAAVVWQDENGGLSYARRHESCEAWWNQWS